MSLFSIFSKKQPPEATSVEEALAGTPTRSRSRKADKEDTDIEVPERKRARRRLIGAVVMVLAVAIGLPMLFDSEPKSLSKNIAIQVASVDDPAESADPDADLIQTEDVEVEEEPAQASSSSSTVTATDEPTPTPAPAQNSAPASAPAPSSSKPKDETAKKRPDDSARALAILNGTDSPSTSKKTTRVIVQVGAFATEAKVTEVRNKLSAAGIKSYTQKVATSSGDKIRVRVGPFDNKEAAEKTKVQLKKIGINASVITL